MTDIEQIPPHALVVLGASGDLTQRKLVPALSALAEQGHLGAGFSLIGVARTEMSDDDFRDRLLGDSPSDAWRQLASRSRYLTGDYNDKETYARLAELLGEVDASAGTAGNRLFYLATPPQLFDEVVDGIADAGLNHPAAEAGFVRVLIEKPYGEDLTTAIELDRHVHAVFAEEQIYRIDHYLGKETVQNVLALRFANAIFEPIWNRRYVDHVQITVAETLGVEHRGDFYEHAGALRDIVQNHVMQVLSLTCMEPPASIDPQGIRDEKVKILRAVDIPTREEVLRDAVRAQYEGGLVDGAEARGYRDEENVAPNSATETYVAMRLRVDNWRWAGVPFYVRTGKRLAKRVTEVVMEFKDVPHLPFKASDARGLGRNLLIMRIQPDEGIMLRFGAKVPGGAFQVRSVAMDFSYEESFGSDPHDAYERLLLDAMTGDPTLFIRTDEVDQAWSIVQPVLDAWADGEVPLDRYPAGSWGPRDADLLLASDGRRWHNP